MTFWQRIKMDAKERFLNYETAKGVYLVPAGFGIIYTALYHIQFVIQAGCVMFGWYLVCEGLRKIWVNRIKQRAKEKELVTQRQLADAMTAAAKSEVSET